MSTLLDSFGLMPHVSRCAVLLKDIWPSRDHSHHLRFHYSLPNLHVNLFGDSLPFLEEMWRYDISLHDSPVLDTRLREWAFLAGFAELSSALQKHCTWPLHRKGLISATRRIEFSWQMPSAITSHLFGCTAKTAELIISVDHSQFRN